MHDSIEVIRPGSTVAIGSGAYDPFEGRVSMARIGEGGVDYLIVWWDGRARCEQWMAPGEVRLVERDGSRIAVGFVATSAPQPAGRIPDQRPRRVP